MQDIGLYRCPVPGNKASTSSKVHECNLPYAAGYRWRNQLNMYFHYTQNLSYGYSQVVEVSNTYGITEVQNSETAALFA